MRYKIKFNNINEDTFYFHKKERIGGFSLDLESFETEYNGLEVILKMNDIFKSFNEEARFAFNMSDASFSYTRQNYLDTTSPFNINSTAIQVGDYVWIDDELCKVIAKVVTGTYTLRGGQNGTRSKIHFKNEDEQWFGYLKGRHSPIGLECNIYNEDDALVFMGYIESLTTSGAGVVLGISSIFNKLDVDINVPVLLNAAVLDKIKDLKTLIYNVGGMSDILDLSNLQTQGLLYQKNDLEEGSFKVNILSVLNNLLNLTASFLVLENEKYIIRTIKGLASYLDSSLIDIFGNSIYKGAYTSSLTRQLTSIAATFYTLELNTEGLEEYVEYKTTARGSGLSGRFSGRSLELNFDAIYVTEKEDNIINKFISNLIINFSLVLGTLQVDVLPDFSIQVGAYYNVPTEYTYFYNTDNITTVKALCVGRDDIAAQFVILNATVYSPVAPMIFGKLVDNGIMHYIEYEQSDIDSVLVTEDENSFTHIYQYKIPGSDLYYFLKSDYIYIYDVTNVFLGKAQIIATGYTNKFAIDIVLPDQDCYFAFPKYSDTDITNEQKKFLFNLTDKV